MNIKSKLISALLSASLAIGTFSAPVFEISAAAYTAPASTSASVSVPDLDIDGSSFIKYIYGKNNFKWGSSSSNIWLYDFCSDMYTGVGNGTDELFYNEMYYGIHAYVNENKVYFKSYENTQQDWEVTEIRLVSDENKRKINVRDAFDYSYINTAGYKNGLYRIEADIKRTDSDYIDTTVMYFYVNGEKTYLCSRMNASKRKIDEVIERRDLLEKLMKDSGVTPENSLATDNLCFPWHPTVGCNDIPNWIELAHKIVKDDWSNSKKALALHEWMTKNLAYDRYKSDVINKRRGTYYKDHSGKQDMYQTKVGVCFDFANIYAAMCRSVGIPAVTVDTDKHTWNAIYLNGRWIEVDMTVDVQREVFTEDVSNISNANSKYGYNGYGTLIVNDATPEKINRWLWTFDNSKDYT